jgi:hypothetical protein
MPKIQTGMKKPILTALSGFLVCSFMAFLFFGRRIFSTEYEQAVVFNSALYASVFFALYPRFNKKVQVFSVIILFFYDQCIRSNGFTGIQLFSVALRLPFIFLAIVLYKHCIEKYPDVPLFIRSIWLIIFLSGLMWIKYITQFLIFNASKFSIDWGFFYHTGLLCFLGLFLGIGFDLYAYLEKKRIL